MLEGNPSIGRIALIGATVILSLSVLSPLYAEEPSSTDVQSGSCSASASYCPVSTTTMDTPTMDTVYQNRLAAAQKIVDKIKTSKKNTLTIAAFEDTATQDTGTVSGVYMVSATAYSSDVAQTDGSPCTTASGYNVCKADQENIIAANFLPIGTKVRFPDVFGDRIFVVQDRMNARYQSRVDFWMKSRSAAIQFGVRRSIKLEVVS